MNNDYTHIAMIIDRSGSMSSCWKDVCGGYEQLIKENKKLAGKCTFTLVAFDTQYDVLEDFTDIQAVSEKLKVFPRGGTALLDAIGRTINSVGDRLKNIKEEERPGKVIVVIQTDGEENSSREFTRSQIKSLISEQSEVYKWEFQFIGASLESVREAATWGIKGCNTAVYNVSNSYDTFNLLGSKINMMRSASTYDAYVKAAAFTEEDREILNEDKKS